MNEYNEGDLVEAVKGDTVIRARLVKGARDWLYVGHLGDVRLVFENGGYTVTVIEPAAPKVELPTEPGWYLIRYDGTRNIHAYDVAVACWGESGWNVEPTVPSWGEITSITRLEPRHETAKAVLDEVSRLADGIHYSKLDRGTFDVCVIGDAAKSFGVSS